MSGQQAEQGPLELSCTWGFMCMQGREEGLQKLKLRVLSTPHRKHVVFSGASVLADIMRSSNDFWIGRDEWAQNPQQALKKCMRL